MVQKAHRRTALVIAGIVAIGSLGLAAPALAVPSTVDLVPASQGGHHKVPHLTVEGAAKSRAAHKQASGGASGLGNLIYHGGTNGVGVTTGPPKVYLIFWGSQWGTSSTDTTTGNTILSADSSGMAPILQQMFKGIGTGGELWSGVMTQFCETTAGATTCPSKGPHVGYPTGGALAGVWYDSATAAPSTATDHAIAVEAYAGAAHFGNTAAGSNRNAQYVVVSPTGTHPGGFNAPLGWCAWHDYVSDPSLAGGPVTSAYGDIAFTNFPYLTDAGSSCGANYVNAGTAGLADGISMVEGHEYAETITDQFPSGGWYDAAGQENADKCTWNGTGGTGGSQNVTLGASGAMPMQATYSNDTSSCLISHAIVTDSGNTVTLTKPANQTGTVGTPITPLTVQATDSNTAITTFTWSATALPAGLSIASATGTISGTPTTKAGYTTTVTATDSTGSQGTTTISWTISGNTVTLTKPASQTGLVGTPITPLTVQATDSNTAITTFTWSATSLPAGLSIDAAAGTISGTPTTKANYTTTVTATDSTGIKGTTTISWTISANTVTLTKPATQTSTRGVTITPLTMKATDSNTAITTFTWSATGLPSGLTLNTSTGVITGAVLSTVTTGNKSVTVTARDSTGMTGKTTFTWTVR